MTTVRSSHGVNIKFVVSLGNGVGSVEGGKLTTLGGLHTRRGIDASGTVITGSITTSILVSLLQSA